MLSSQYSEFRRVFRPRPAARHTAPHCRPRLEVLDGRTLPSGVTSLNMVAAPNVNGSNLNGVAEIASNDVWAVGGVTNPTTDAVQPLAEHFNGTSWSVVATPTLASGNFFTGVAGVAGNDVWAVGTGSSSTLPLAEHWNGTTWSVVPTASLSSGGGTFNAVTAIASNDVWAVGVSANHDLIENWNGTSWNVFSTPTFAHSGLLGVSGTSANDVWAVGSAGSGRSESGVQILNFNGTTWSTVTAPSPGIEPSLMSVTAVSPTDAWAVGVDPNSTTNEALIENWNGTSWSVVASPNVNGVADILFGVAAVSANNVWAVGRFGETNANVLQTLTENWNGTSWSVVPSPNVKGGGSDLLDGVTANPSTGDVVAVGAATLANAQANSLILANNETAGSTPGATTPTPTPTPPPGTGVTDVEVIGTLANLTPDHGNELHKLA